MSDPKLSCVIVDDEPLARSTLRRLVSADPELELVAECQNGKEALTAVLAHRPDLLVLDVQMPGLDGFGVVEALQSGDGSPANGSAVPMVLFATAYDRFALKAFEVHAVDYLLKPFDDERFREAITRAKSRHKLERVATLSTQLRALLDTMKGVLAVPAPAGRFLERLTVSHAGRTEIVPVTDILWIEAADQYVLIHTATSDHLMRESMSDLEQRLDPARFVRIHRSAMVALPYVRRFDRDPTGTGKVLVGKDMWLPVSRTRTALLKEKLG